VKSLRLEDTTINIAHFIGKLRKEIIRYLNLLIGVLKRKNSVLNMYMVNGFIFKNLLIYYNLTKFVIVFSYGLEVIFCYFVYIGSIVRHGIRFGYNKYNYIMCVIQIWWRLRQVGIMHILSAADCLPSKTSLLQMVPYSWLFTDSNTHSNEIPVTSFTTTSRIPIRQ
jgi:hypothetical protein